MSKRPASDEILAETPKRVRFSGESSGQRTTLPRQSDTRIAGGFGRFVAESLTEGPQDSTTVLQQAATRSAQAAHQTYLAACAEEEMMMAREADVHIIRSQTSQIERLKARLDKELRETTVLKRKVDSLSRMAPVLEKRKLEWQDAKMAQLTLVKSLELVRAELAQAKAENAELMRAGIAQEKEADLRVKAAREEADRAKETARERSKEIARLQSALAEMTPASPGTSTGSKTAQSPHT